VGYYLWSLKPFDRNDKAHVTFIALTFNYIWATILENAGTRSAEAWKIIMATLIVLTVSAFVKVLAMKVIMGKPILLSPRPKDETHPSPNPNPSLA